MMKQKNIALLGSTGSIGTQTLDAVRVLNETNHPCKIVGLAAYKNVDLIERQILDFGVKFAAMEDAAAAAELQKRLAGKDVTVFYGKDGVLDICRLSEADTVVNALSGCSGLVPTIEAVKAGKDIALANKESLVAGGAFVKELQHKHGVEIKTIDSEHSAIMQCLQGESPSNVAKIHLTASGGPFRTFSAEQLETATAQYALKHPTWNMGAKITIDSATLMNKGLEVIEAMWLFDIPLEKIEVVVHPQSIVHSMVEFTDGAVMAQLGAPDMRVPILYALTHPNRAANNFTKLNMYSLNGLTFEKPNRDLFPCLSLAEEAAKRGGNLPAVLNAANEAAVSLFLSNKIAFTQIPRLIESAMSAYDNMNEHCFSIETVLHYSDWAMEYINGVV